MRGIRGILFDLDGVLVDSRAAWLDTLNEILSALDLPPASEARFAETFGQSSAEDARVFFGERIDGPALDARYAEAFPRHVGRIRRIEPATPHLLETLRSRGVRTAITTNAPGPTAAAMLAATGLTGAVETIVNPDDVARPKPAPDMLVEACRRLDLSTDAVLLVGDSSSDLGAGEAAGVRVAGFRIDGGTCRIESLAEILDLLD